MLNLLVTLPLQFACQLIGPVNISNGNVTLVENMSMLNQPATYPEGYITFPDIGVAYKYYNDTDANWNEARKRCISEGANLAVLDSFKKIRYALSVKKNDTAPHVGIHRSYDNIEWTSVKTGLPLSSIPWAPEPSLGTLNWNCAALYPDGRGLAARKCNTGRSFICEISASTNVNYLPPPAPTHTIILPGGYTVFPDVGVAYKFYKNYVTWESAWELCIAEGASLSVVDSFKKIEYIMGLKDINAGTWTGVRKQRENDQWTNFKTGKPVDYIPWRPNANADTGLCIANRHDTLGVSPWNCDNLVPVICEIPIFKNEGNQAYITQGRSDTIVLN